MHIHALKGFSKDSQVLEMQLILPLGEVVGQYQIKGKLFTLPLNGKGNIRVIMEQMKISAKITLNRVIRGGYEYLGVESVKIKVNPKK